MEANPAVTCPACGAPASEVICAYCGALTAHLASVEAEKNALEVFHHLVAGEKDPARQGALLQHGFFPEHTANLIEAGLRCSAIIGTEEVSTTEPLVSALGRLRSIIIRLKIASESPEARRAAQEFEAILKHQRWVDTRAFLIGMLLILVPVLLVVGVVWWLVSLFWR